MALSLVVFTCRLVPASRPSCFTAGTDRGRPPFLRRAYMHFAARFRIQAHRASSLNPGGLGIVTSGVSRGVAGHVRATAASEDRGRILGALALQSPSSPRALRPQVHPKIDLKNPRHWLRCCRRH
ncbi:hypothetical protein GGX14DRAFT_561307 [Mycena pura]|uniref:Secreted protein n=1 Tax=Mycena pura TaxID=153505 RepID=A0AAD6YJ52_9AGAR|nr:hypothetical protein GGX14DRAFT_561307 [Mycena pura]